MSDATDLVSRLRDLAGSDWDFLLFERNYDTDKARRGYSASYSIRDSANRVAFSTDVFGNCRLQPTEILDAAGNVAVSIHPRRKILNTKFDLRTGPSDDVIGTFVHHSGKAGKHWAVLDGSEREVMSVIDESSTRTRMLRTILQGSRNSYSMKARDTTIAVLSEHTFDPEAESRGLLAKAKSLLKRKNHWVLFLSDQQPDPYLLVPLAILIQEISVTGDKSI